VYLDTPDECVVTDPILGRRIRVAKSGSRTTVVWNPWVEKTRRLSDFPDDHYTTMVCVEAANAEGDVRSLPAGGSHTLTQTISVENV
jgi:glucose-6-phosphate 1-epimerase